MTTPSLFDFPRSMPLCEAKRLGGQCAAILARLREGPATNRELANISLKYTGRLSDLRAAGYVIECVKQDHETGLTFYKLVERTNPVGLPD